MARRSEKTLPTPREQIKLALRYSEQWDTQASSNPVPVLVAQNHILAVLAEAALDLLEIQKMQFAMASEAFESVKHLVPSKPPKRKRKKVKKGQEVIDGLPK